MTEEQMMLEKVDTEQVDLQAQQAIHQAQAMQISDDKTCTAAAEALKALKSLLAEINDTFDPVVKAAHEAHKQALQAKKKHSEPVLQAEGIIKRKLGIYVADQEKARAIGQARLEAEARKKAEDERLAAAVAAEEQGDKEESERILDEPTLPDPVQAPPAAPKIKGVSYSDVWKYRITDEAKIPRKYMMPNTQQIGAVARAMKDRADIPGIEVYSEKQVAAGRA